MTRTSTLHKAAAHAFGGAPAMGWVCPAAAAPVVGGAPRVDSTRVVVLGSGGIPVSAPLGVAIDARAREIALANTGAGRVDFFDFRGRPRGAFLHTVVNELGNTVNGLPQQVAIDAQGHILVVDAYSPDIWVRDFRGALVERVRLPAPDDRRETGGAGVMAVAADGRIFVASRNKSGRVHVLAPDFRHLETWGVAGEEPGQLGAITGLAVLGSDEVAVTCLFTELGVQVFDVHGQYRRGFGVHDVGHGNVSQPVGVIADASSRLWLLDAVRRTLQLYDSAGVPLSEVGGGDGPGAWLYPSALASDGHGLFAMAESGGNRLRLLWIGTADVSREAIAPATADTSPTEMGNSSVTIP